MSGPIHPLENLPAPLSEELMIDWIDGVISDSEGRRLAEAAGRPEMVEYVAQMRANRGVLLSLEAQGAHGAPPELLGRVLAATGYAQGAEVEESVPAPISFIEAQAAIRRGAEKRHSMRRYALAAGVAVLFGGTSYMIWSAVSQNRAAQKLVAMANPAAPGAPAKAAGALAKNADSTNESGVIADHDTSPDDPAPTVDGAAALAMNTPTEVYGPELPGDGPEMESATTRLVFDPREAHELARQGRLLMRVAETSGRTLPEIDSLVAGNGAWHVSSDVSQALVEAVRPYFIVADATQAGGHSERALAGVEDIVGPPQPVAEGESPRMAFSMAGPDATTYMVEVDDDLDALDSLKTAAMRSFSSVSVVFEELPTAVPTTGTGRRLSVPVIVERR